MTSNAAGRARCSTRAPPAGTKIKANVTVVLTVSGTQTSVSVPSVVGQSPDVGRRDLSAAPD